MAFDPDAYLAEDIAERPPQAADVQEGFDPDTYLVDEPEIDQPVTQPLQPAEPDRNKYLDPYIGIGETVKGVASGLAGSIAGGLSGAVSAPFVGADEAADITRDIQKAFAEFGAPQTEIGAQTMETLGDYIQSGIDIANIPISGLAGALELISGQDITEAMDTVESIKTQGVGKTAGNRAFEVTGDPLWAAAAETSPEALASLLPITKLAKTRTALRQKMVDEIKANPRSTKLVDYMIDGSGKIKTDKIAKEAIKQGFDQGVVATIKGASKTDRVKMKKMIDILKKGKDDALFAAKNRPSQVAGNSLLERVNHVKKVNVDAGKKLDSVAKSLKGKPGNFDQPISQFIDDLDEMGITINNKLQPVFKGSDIEGLAGPQAAIKNMIHRMSSGAKGKTPDAYEIHRMKKYIDEQVTYGKSAEGLSGKTEKVLKKLRKNLDESLDAQYPEYNKVNTTYSDTIDALDSFQDVAGKKMDLFGPNANEATGTLLGRMMSNAQSRVNLVDSVGKLEDIAKKYGGKFDDDITSQMLFVDELNSKFGPAAETSFAGETAKGVKKGVVDAAQGRSFTEIAAQAGGKVIERVSGVNDESALKAISDLLSR